MAPWYQKPFTIEPTIFNLKKQQAYLKVTSFKLSDTESNLRKAKQNKITIKSYCIC